LYKLYKLILAEKPSAARPIAAAHEKAIYAPGAEWKQRAGYRLSGKPGH